MATTIDRKITSPSSTELSKSATPVEPLGVTPPTTPNTNSTAAHQLLSEIRDIYTTLAELNSLAPSDTVNTLLTRLVNLCVVQYSTDFTAYFFRIPGVESLCANLRPLCSEAEGELEGYWAKRMLNELSGVSRKPASAVLNSFPYHQNYIDLSRLETSTIAAFLPASPANIAFIGSGPLPLTSLCFLDRYPACRVHNVDRDASALSLSKALCEKLGYGDRMTYSCEDVTVQGEGSDWASFDVVFLAALVGTDTHTKLSILGSLAKKLTPGALVVARSAKGMRSVLYPILELSEDLQAVGFDILAEVHPWTKVVNSVVVLQVKQR